MDRTERLDALIALHGQREGPLLPILNEVQATFGCIDEAAKRYIADAVNLSRAEVQGVVSFYHDYRAATATRPVLKICRAEACQARGVESMLAALGPDVADKVEIETVYCLGLCSVGPAALTQARVVARLNADRLTALIGELV